MSFSFMFIFTITNFRRNNHTIFIYYVYLNLETIKQLEQPTANTRHSISLLRYNDC